MTHTEFEICMMAVAECREMIQNIKADLDPYICMKEENLKRSTEVLSASIVDAINGMTAIINPGSSNLSDSSTEVDVNKSLGDTIDIELIKDSNGKKPEGDKDPKEPIVIGDNAGDANSILDNIDLGLLDPNAITDDGSIKVDDEPNTGGGTTADLEHVDLSSIDGLDIDSLDLGSLT